MSANANSAFQNFDDDGEIRRSELIERRSPSRACFIGEAEVTEPLSGAVISARTDNLSFGGCFVDTPTPFRTGTVVDLRLTRDGVLFETQATVVSSQPKLGMSLAFDPAEEDQYRILEVWLSRFDGAPAEARNIVDLPKPELETEEEVESDSVGPERLVLNQLILVLLRKGLLSEDEARTMLGPLFL